MIKNSYISLEPTSKVRLDAANTLKYTLFLERQTEDLENLKNLKNLAGMIGGDERSDVHSQIFFLI